jgi:hypothetical protein
MGHFSGFGLPFKVIIYLTNDGHLPQTRRCRDRAEMFIYKVFGCVDMEDWNIIVGEGIREGA